MSVKSLDKSSVNIFIVFLGERAKSSDEVFVEGRSEELKHLGGVDTTFDLRNECQLHSLSQI